MNKVKVDEILNDLSYRFSTPEASDFYRAINEGKFSKARTMLAKEISEEDVNILMEYLIAEKKQKYALNEFPLKEVGSLKEGDSVVLNYSGIVLHSKLYMSNNNLCFYYDSTFITISKVQQIWLVTKI